MIRHLIVLILIAIAVASCATQPIGSVAGGECRVTHTPTYAVRGKTTYDQGWIDDTTEALVRGCKQKRPSARPASLDAAVKAVPLPTAKPVPVKLHWWQKLKRKP